MKSLNKYSVVLSLVFAVFIIGAGFVYAQVSDNKIKDVTYPIAELGNCENKQACKAYCDNTDNITACAAFAAKKGWISKEEADNAKEFAGVLKGKGPGGCTDKNSCKNYCEDITHADECLAFAQEHNLLPKAELEEAKKVSKAIKEGAKLPGDCRNKTACDAYCKNKEHVEECFAFAEKAGFMKPEEIAEAKKIIPLMKAGQTPGKCTSKEECEAYCEDESHFNECINFAEKAGFMSKEELQMAKKTGGKGPGGCKSKDQCDKFCNDPKNQTVCFNFAKEHDLIPPEKLEEMKEGMGRLKAGIQQAPPEVVQCLKDNLGENIITDIESGTLVPGPEIGDRVKACFEKFMPQVRERMGDLFQKAPPEVMSCLEQNVGKENLEKMKSGEAPDPTVGEKMKACFEKMREAGLDRIRQGLGQLPPQALECIKSKLGAEKFEQIKNGTLEIDESIGDVFGGCTEGIVKQMESQMGNQIEAMPPQMKECIVNKFGSDFSEKLGSGQLDQNSFQTAVKECASKMQPGGMMPPKYPPPEGFEGKEFPMMPPQEGFSGAQMPPLPPQIKDCVVNKLGGDFEEKMKSGEIDPTKLQAVVKECASQMQPSGGMMPPAPTPEGFEGGAIPPKYPTGPIPSTMPSAGQLPVGNYPLPPQPPSTELPTNISTQPFATPVQGPVLTPELCGKFATVPTCEMVPESAREICKQCKGQ